MKRALLLALLLAACSTETTAPTVAIGNVEITVHPLFSVQGDSVAGHDAFIAACSSCHASRDGFDLAYFSYTDTNIVRRALGHVTQPTADDIAAYILSIRDQSVPEMTLLWQPGGSTIPGGLNATCDQAFAVATFGINGVPMGLTNVTLLAKDPRQVRVCLDFFVWSTEATSHGTLEWMNKDSLPQSVLTARGNAVINTLATYHADPDLPNLEAVLTAIDSGAVSIPCNDKTNTWNGPVCLEIKRYAASLSATHMLRNNVSGFLSSQVHLQWWQIGRMAQKVQATIADWPRQAAFWEYIGWSFDPVNEPAIYTASTLTFVTIALPRHAVWVALRSEVARLPGAFGEDVSPYVDFKVFTGVTPTGTAWAYQGATFALNELLRRLNSGDVPPTSALRLTAKTKVNEGMTQIQPKVTGAEYTTLNALANQVRAGLQ